MPRGGVMGGKYRAAVAAIAVSGLVLAVSLVSVSVAGSNVRRIHVIEHAATDTVVDLTTNGDSTGDLLTFHNEVFDAANQKVVGSSHGDCIRIEVAVSWECRWVTTLEAGSLTVEGPFLDAGASVLAITGGTGEFRGARGSMRLIAHNAAATEFDFVFRVLTG
jgi:allene oxide cyclase